MDKGELVKPDAAIIGEPTSLEPCIAQKGLLVLKLKTTGESGHAARIYGNNAIYEMVEVLSKLKSVSFSEENPFIGNTKITPTKFQAGTVNNAMPEQSEVILDIRTIPEVSNEDILARLNEVLSCEIIVHSDRFVSTQTDADSLIARVAREVTGKDYFGSPTASDWVFLSDIPVVKLGPGRSELSHKANEHISIEQLNKGVEVYKSIIKKYFEEISK